MIIETDDEIREILQTVKTIAVVGCSPNEGAKNYVPHYLKELGYRIIPVNPLYNEVLGEKCYPNLKAIPEKIDMIDCFRPAKDIPPIAEDAIAIGAKVLWMQLGIINTEAAQHASDAGLDVIMNRCPVAEIPRLIHEKADSWKEFKKKHNPPSMD